jgi:hypothetical protein
MRIAHAASAAVLASLCLSAASQDAAPAVPATPGAAAAPAAPAPDAGIDPDTLFKGRMGGTFGKGMAEVMPQAKKIAVAGFRMAFVVDNQVTAQVRAAYMPGGLDSSGARSSYQIGLQGVNASAMQAITDRAFADLLQKLAQSGREVVPPAQMKECIAGFKPTATSPAQPYAKSANGQTLHFFTPTGMPLVFTHLEGQWGDAGMFDLGNYRKLQECSSVWGAAVIAPFVVVNFAQMSSSGNRSAFTARVAETGAELAVSVASLTSPWMRTEEFRNGMLMKGDEGGFNLAAPVVTAREFGSVVVQAQDNNASEKAALDTLGRVFALAAGGRLGGGANMGGAARSSTKAVAKTDDLSFGSAVLEVVERTNTSFAAWLRKYPPAH